MSLPGNEKLNTGQDEYDPSRQILAVGDGIAELVLDVAEGLSPHEYLRIMGGIAVLAHAGQDEARGMMMDAIHEQIGKQTKPVGHNVRRQEYGEAILPVGSAFVIKTPEKGDVTLVINEKSISTSERTELLNPHKLFAMSVFLRNPGIPFYIRDLDRAGLYHLTQGGQSRHQRISSLINELAPDMRRLINGSEWTAESPIEFAGDRNRTYTWKYPTEETKIIQLVNKTAEPKSEAQKKPRLKVQKSVYIKTIPTNLKLEGNRLVEKIENNDEASLEDSKPGIAINTEQDPAPDIPAPAEVVEDLGFSELPKVETIDLEVVAPTVKEAQQKEAMAIKWHLGEFLFNGQAAKVSDIEADLLKILYVAPEDGISVGRLVSFMRLLHPKINTLITHDLIDILNKPFRFPKIAKLIDKSIKTDGSNSSEIIKLEVSLKRPTMGDKQKEEMLRVFIAAQKLQQQKRPN